MKNLIRALHFSWPYRWRFLASVLCAFLVAVLWGANISAIYPFLNILGSDQNMQQWIAEQIKESDRQVEVLTGVVERLKQEQAALEAQPPTKERERRITSVLGNQAREENKLSAAKSRQYWQRIGQHYIIKLLPSDRFETLVWILLFVIIAVIMKGLFDFWQESLVGSIVGLTIFDLRNRFFRETLKQDVTQFTQQGTHQLMARFTNDMETLATGMKTLYGKVVAEPLKAIVCIVIACLISWRLTMVFMIIVPLALFLMSKVAVYMKRAGRKVLDTMTNLYKILQESFTSIKVVKAFTMERYERRRLLLSGKHYYKQSMRVVNLEALSGPVMETLAAVAIALALLVGGYLVIESQTEVLGLKLMDQPPHWMTLIQLYFFLVAIAEPVRKLSNVYNKLQSAAAASDRIFEFMDRQPRITPNPLAGRLPRHKRCIVLRDVCFSYRPDAPVLSHINLEVKFGETIALVGKNGCGKTTLVGLLGRLYDPDHGSILIDGYDLRQVNLRSLRQQLGLVTQETLLFDDTVAANIAYGHRHATAAQVEAAAKKAYAHDFITRLPAGYDTIVGEMGMSLSGGQRQRICLARAILRDPTLLILDEATSAADPESEALIHQALKEFTRARTTFLITHRLSTLEIADRIVLLDEGKIAAVGTHADLMRSCELYARLQEIHLQRKAA
jgi:subfamily B ATP-binding cassette protein MsbA